MVAPAMRYERRDTTQRVVWGFFMRRRIRDRGLSLRSGRNGSNWFLYSPERLKEGRTMLTTLSQDARGEGRIIANSVSADRLASNSPFA